MRVKTGRSVVTAVLTALGLFAFAASSAWAEETYYTLAVTPTDNASYTATTNDSSSVAQAVVFDSNNQAQIIAGSAVTFTVTTNAHYQYTTAPDDWTGVGDSAPYGQLTRAVTVSADTGVSIPAPTPIFHTLTLTTDANAAYTATTNGETVTFSGDTLTAQIIEGSTVAFTATAGTGWIYSETPTDWTGTGKTVTRDFEMPAADAAITIPAPSAYSLTLTVTPSDKATYAATSGGATVEFTDNQAQIIEGSTVSFTATAKTDYEYKTVPTDWSGSGESPYSAVTRDVVVSEATTVAIPDPELTDPVTVTITPAKQAPYTVSVTGHSEIEFVDNSASVPRNATIPVAATLTYPNYWKFSNLPSGWTQDGNTISQTFTPAADLTITIPTPIAVPKAVTVADKAGYTNIAFTVQVPSAATYNVIVKDLDGNTVGTVSKELRSGEQTFTVAADDFTGGTVDFTKGKTYTYTVQGVGSASFSDVGWKTNSYFAASAATGASVTINGDWATGDEPEIEDNKFQIDTTQAVFKVENVRQSSSNAVISLETEMSLDTYYYLDDITNDIPVAIAALALVTNEEQEASAAWMVLTNGDTWVSLTGTDLPLDLGDYTTRIEMDYNDAAIPRVRYSVKPAVMDAWITLKTSTGAEWFYAKAAAPTVSNVCFIGKADVAGFAAQLSTTANAEVNGQDYDSVVDAMAAAGNKTIVLYTNIEVDPSKLSGGPYTFNWNGKTFGVLPHTWLMSDGKGKTIEIDGTTLTIVEKVFVAKIGTDANAYAFTSLADAFAADECENATIIALTNIAESATSTKTAVALDLDGWVLRTGSADKPVVTVTGADAQLLVLGGAITGATEKAAIAATEGALVAIDDLILTNNTKTLSATYGATVVISNGIVKGELETDNDVDTKIKIVGGYIVAKEATDITFMGTNYLAVGGKFTEVSSNKLASIRTGGVIPATFKFVEFAIPVETNGYTFTAEVVTNVLNQGSAVASKVWSVEQDGGTNSIGGVQIPDATIAEIAGDDWASSTEKKKAAQAKLNETTSYAGKANGIKRWERVVLGMTQSTTDAGPCVKGVQDSKIGVIGFNILSPEVIKAKESGCDVKFQIEEYTDSSLSTKGTRSTEKVDYTQTAEIAAPSKDEGVRYYKLKVFISPAK